MANLDITRHLLRPSKHYVGARMQQGRSVLDSDWNEDAMLRGEELRRTFVELIGAQGSSNAGFGIGEIDTFVHLSTADGTQVTTYDFGLKPGSFWVGGMRLTVDGDPETFLSQLDWLQLDASAANLPTQPTAQDLLGPPNLGDYYFYQPGLVAAKRWDLVYMEAWEQPVTAVEDSELRERALGGPDTSARVRRMRRIHVLPELGSSDIVAGFDQLGKHLQYEPTGVQSGSIDLETFELASAARLTVAPVTEVGDQPCGPTPASGYTGHEDRTIRVELRGPTSFVWGFGNAAPLHRARIGAGRVVTLLTRPRDLNSHPQIGQIAELIPWGSKLPNHEKAADLTGHLVRITGAYNPATGEFEIENPPDALVAWLTSATRHYKRQDPEPRYIYVRIWDRGPDINSDTVIDAQKPQAVPLGHTGLQVTLEGAGRSGDYWTIAARRSTPEVVVPWQLLTSQPPQGPRRFFSPLAIITWEAPLQWLSHTQQGQLEAGTFFTVPRPYMPEYAWDIGAVFGPVVGKVTDLRRPLTRLCMRGCATLTVGDADVSFGMVDSLEEALALLPASGGRIDLLRGVHRVPVEGLVLEGRSNITICGCGLDSSITAFGPVVAGASIYTMGAPLLTLKNCSDIVLKKFNVVAEGVIGIKLEDEEATTNRNVRIFGVRFSMDGAHDPENMVGENYALAQAAILALGSEGLKVERCFVEYSDVLNYTPAMVLGGSNLCVRDNAIHARDKVGSELGESMGGLQILSFSRNVEVTGNVIRGGWGHGITLGHLLDVTTTVMLGVEELDAKTSWAALGAGRALGDMISNMHEYSPSISEAPTGGDPRDWTPGGPVIDVLIRDNRILGKGFSGISTGGFARFDLPQPRFIIAINVDIHRNEIIGNLRVPALESTPFDGGCLGVGGICLAASVNACIRNNVITDNGVNFEIPTVGVGFITAQGAIVEDNIITDNGPAVGAPNTPLTFVGLRGGITLLEVTPIREQTIPDALPGIAVIVPAYNVRNNSVALTIRENEVRQRTGKALWVLYGFGPMIVRENSLHGLGDPVTMLAISHSFLALPDVGGATPVLLPAQAACVEIHNYGYSQAVVYDGEIPSMKVGDLSTPTIEGGAIDFCRNAVSLNWYWEDGYAASVLLSSLDSVKVTDNVMVAVMGSEYSPAGEPDPSVLYNDLITAGPTGQSFLIVNCWAGAPVSVQASGNRFEEPVYDCLFSYLGAHAAAFGDIPEPDLSLTELRMATATTMNVGSHCLVSKTLAGSPVSSRNAEVYATVPGCGSAVELSEDGEDQIVAITTT